MKKNLSGFGHLMFVTAVLVLVEISFLPAWADGATAAGGTGSGGNGGNSGAGGPTASTEGGGSGGTNGQLFSNTNIVLPFSIIKGEAGGDGFSGTGVEIADGGGGGAGGFGLVLINAIGASTSGAQLTGGQGGAGGNAGEVSGNSAGGGGGGTGFYLQSSSDGISLINTGPITGGDGGHGGSSSAEVGNGSDGGAGGTGLYLQATGASITLINTNSIKGGQGGTGGNGGVVTGNGGDGSAGGTGLYLQSTGPGGNFINTGSITGGQGGNGGSAAPNLIFTAGDGGDGGAGVYLDGASQTFTNQGTVTGGADGMASSRGTNGTPGFGVGFSGVGTLVNQGNIFGGVQMAAGANSVTLFTGSQIDGDLNMGVNTSQQLILTGTGTQNFSSAVTGAINFSGSLIKQGSGSWTLDRNLGDNVNITVQSGTLIADGASLGSQLKLAGGTFNANGFSPAAFTQALTVDGAGSALDFGVGHTDAVTLQFADSSGANWTSDLTLLDFTVGTDALDFGTDANGLTQAQLADISLDGYKAIGLDSAGFVEFETVAVPEPDVSLLVLCGLAAMFFSFWRSKRA